MSEYKKALELAKKFGADGLKLWQEEQIVICKALIDAEQMLQWLDYEAMIKIRGSCNSWVLTADVHDSVVGQFKRIEAICHEYDSRRKEMLE